MPGTHNEYDVHGSHSVGTPDTQTVKTNQVMNKINLFALLLTATILTAQSNDLYRFYDFGIEIDFRHGLLDDDFKIIFPNGFKYDHLNENSLYHITYSYDQARNRIAIDTLKVELNKAQMNKLFELTSKQFQINFRENLSVYKIPPPPPINDGMVADLTFDLMFRGDLYSRSWSYPYGDKTFRELSDYIEELLSNK
jgi:hypothetical protein